MTAGGRAGVSATTSPTLERRLGPVDAAAIVVSNVIGSGIFFVPIIVAGLITDARGMLFAWLLGGCLAFAGAMAYAELAALRPRAGGEYVYLREAYGPLAGFLSGWTSFVAGFSGGIAAGAIGIAGYVGRFLPAAADTTPLLTIPLPLVPMVVSRQTLVALSLIAALTFVHLRGLGPGRVVQNALALVKVVAFVLFVAIGFSIGQGNPAQIVAPGTIGVTPLLLAMVPIMFAYSGWNAGAYLAEEIRSPERNLPIALGLGTVVVIAIYLALNALFLYALSPAELAAPSGALMDTVAERLFGTVAGRLLAAFSIVSISAGVSAMMIAGPRVYFAMARDGVFLPSMGVVHPKSHVPSRAIIAQAMWSGVLVLSGTLSQLVSYTGFAIVLFSSIAVAAVFVLRHRRPDQAATVPRMGISLGTRHLRAHGCARARRRIRRTPETSLAGLAIIAAGIPVYWWMRRGTRAR